VTRDYAHAAFLAAKPTWLPEAWAEVLADAEGES